MLNSGLRDLFCEAELEKWSDNKPLLGLCRGRGGHAGSNPDEINKKMGKDGKLCHLVLLVSLAHLGKYH